MLYLVDILFSLLQSGILSPSFLVFYDLDHFWRAQASYFVHCLSVWVWLMSPQEHLRNDVSSGHHIRRYRILVCPITEKINFDCLINVLFARIFHCKLN